MLGVTWKNGVPTINVKVFAHAKVGNLTLASATQGTHDSVYDCRTDFMWWWLRGGRPRKEN
jgi:hypothetical protein